MNPITDIWRQLVRRRLWPVAILLVGALAAVPVLLAKDAEPTIPPVPAAATSDDGGGVLATDPIVAETAVIAPGKAKRLPLGKRHDIFKPTKKPVKVKPAQDDAADETPAETPAAGTDKPEETAPSGSGGGTTTPATPEPAPAEPEAPKTYPLYSLKVRFSGGDESVKGILPRLEALPSAENPLIIYLGLEDDKKTAVFMLDSTIQAIGDGECHPTPENCETVRMQEGDTMFFDVVGEDSVSVGGFELTLLDINKKRTADAKKSAKSSRLADAAKTSSLHAGAAGLGTESLRRLGVVTRTG